MSRFGTKKLGKKKRQISPPVCHSIKPPVPPPPSGCPPTFGASITFDLIWLIQYVQLPNPTPVTVACPQTTGNTWSGQTPLTLPSSQGPQDWLFEATFVYDNNFCLYDLNVVANNLTFGGAITGNLAASYNGGSPFTLNVTIIAVTSIPGTIQVIGHT